MKSTGQKRKTHGRFKRSIGNILTPVFASVIFAALFVFQTDGHAEDTCKLENHHKIQYIETISKTARKLPENVTREKGTITFDHMYRKNR